MRDQAKYQGFGGAGITGGGNYQPLAGRVTRYPGRRKEKTPPGTNRDIVMTKRTWGAFPSTDLESQLKAEGVTQVVLVGVATGTGVEATARQAYEHGFNVTLAVDAMTDTRPESHAYSLSHVFPRLGETGTTQEIIDLLAKRNSN